jgi:hypothetical protein
MAYRYRISGRNLIMGDVMKTMRLLVAGGMLLGAGLPVLAHHVLALEFKTGQIITLAGIVTKIDWSNPHTRLYLDAQGDGGEVMKWDFEMDSPNLLTLRGVKIDTFRRGDHVTISAYPSRDGSNHAYVTRLSRTKP